MKLFSGSRQRSQSSGDNSPSINYRGSGNVFIKYFGRSGNEIEKDRPPPRPTFLPESISQSFKGREDQLEKLHGSLTQKTSGQSVVVLSGQWGIGKTRIAVEYAWAHRNDYSALLFVAANSPESLRHNLAKLSGPLLLPQRRSANEDEQLQAVLEWLQTNSRWLLILDGVDTDRTLIEVQNLTGSLVGGHSLITSQLKDFPVSFTKQPVMLLELQAAEAFLLDRTPERRHDLNDAEQARQLANELGYLPLALEHAGAYIQKNQIAFTKYLKIWDNRPGKIIDWPPGPLTPDYPRSVKATCLISIARLTDAGRHLLERLAFFAPSPVPEFLLSQVPPDANVRDLGEAITELAEYSLVNRDREKQQFSMHRLVQVVILDSLNPPVSKERLTEALAWMDAAFVGNPQDGQNWQRLDPLWPHALAIAEHAQGKIACTHLENLENALALLMTAKTRHAQRAIELGFSPGWLPSTAPLIFTYAKFEKALEPLEGLTNLRELILTGIHDGDVGYLATWANLDRLDLGRTKVISIKPLAKLTSLRKLDLWRTKIRDLAPIAGLKNLESLSLGHTLATDISALADLYELQCLDLSDTPIKNVVSLAGLRNLMRLGLGGTHVRDTSALQGLTKLCRLDLSDTKVTDLTPLAKLGNLEELKLNGTKVRDVSALANLTNLSHLDLSSTRVKDISALANLINLRVLSLGGCRVTVVTYLRCLENLLVLNLGYTGIRSIEALKGLTNLWSLDLRGTPVHDVRPISELPDLRSIDLAYTAVTDVSALAELFRLETVHLEGTRVRDVGMLTSKGVRVVQEI